MKHSFESDHAVASSNIQKLHVTTVICRVCCLKMNYMGNNMINLPCRISLPVSIQYTDKAGEEPGDEAT